MSVTYGFYDSENHDRVYNAEEFGSLFDGLIHDGVYATYKGGLLVRANEMMGVVVSTGRAWFNHTWTYLDADYIVSLNPAPAIIDRIDAVVLRIDKRLNYRKNSIEVIQGAPSSSPEKPVVEHNPEEGVYQYPLAYVTVRHGELIIGAADVENVVGTADCPFVVGVIEHITTDELIVQWEAEFELTEAAFERAFNQWFSNLRYSLDGDVAGHLQNEIDRLFIDPSGFISMDYNYVNHRDDQ